MAGHPLKPEVCVLGDRRAVFMGADYKLLDLDQADRFCRIYQSELAKLRRQIKRARRRAREQQSITPETTSHG